MTEQQYRVIADRDKGDDPSRANIRVGDRYTLQDTGDADDQLVRIERPVPTTDAPHGEEVEIEGSFFPVADLPHILGAHIRALDDAGQREKQHWIDHHEHPSLPTREQIAEAIEPDPADRDWQTVLYAGRVLTLLQKGADR